MKGEATWWNPPFMSRFSDASPFNDHPDLRHARADGIIGLVGALLVAISAAGVAGGAMWTTRKPEPRLEVLELSVGLETVPVREAWIRRRSARAPSEPVELVVPFGELATDAPASLHAKPVLITLAPSDGAMLPQDRPRNLYARFLAAETSRAAGGLIRRRFRPGTPFEGEDLMLAPPDGRAFSARCLDGGAASPVTASCVSELRFGRIDVQMRFSPALLERWDSLVLGALARFGTPAAGARPRP